MEAVICGFAASVSVLVLTMGYRVGRCAMILRLVVNEANTSFHFFC